MDEGLYGERLAKLLPMVEQPSLGIVKSLRRGTFAAMRLAYSGPGGVQTLPTPPDEAFAVVLQLRRQRVNVSINGQRLCFEGLKDEISILDLRNEYICYVQDPFEILYCYFSRSALGELANEHGVGRVRYEMELGLQIHDPIVAHLGSCLLPAVENAHEANELFVGYVAMALGTHLLRAHARLLGSTRSRRSGLAPWQLRTAKALMHTHLDGELSLARIAAECGLSTPHFARAFKASTGTPPHRWLMDQRIAESKRLLTDSSLSLTEIAIKCGFSDQSHFTRAFAAAVGAPPRRWRLTRKN